MKTAHPVAPGRTVKNDHHDAQRKTDGSKGTNHYGRSFLQKGFVWFERLKRLADLADLGVHAGCKNSGDATALYQHRAGVNKRQIVAAGPRDFLRVVQNDFSNGNGFAGEQ